MYTYKDDKTYYHHFMIKSIFLNIIVCKGTVATKQFK